MVEPLTVDQTLIDFGIFIWHSEIYIDAVPRLVYLLQFISEACSANNVFFFAALAGKLAVAQEVHQTDWAPSS